ncbi:MAG: thioredoxin family protein [Moraxellaceae bacterium]|nr:thioredoxin family protein [Moraxellaceae bacterium]
MHYVSRLMLVLMLLATCMPAHSMPLPLTQEVRTDHLTSRFVASETVIVPGRVLRVGLLLEHDPHWHTYWKNSGDSGAATRLDFALPAGFVAGDIRWPVPERLPTGDLINFGYSQRQLLPVMIQVPSALEASEATLTLKADWLVCQEECIPGEATYELTLPVAGHSTPDPRWAEDFARAEAAQPKSAKAMTASYTIADGLLHLHLSGALPADIAERWLLPETPQIVSNSAMPEWHQHASGWVATLPLSDYYHAMPTRFPLLLAGPKDAFRLVALPTTVTDNTAAPAPIQAASLLIAVVLALLGGLVLNLMPCVFPVLSFKALGALQHADDRQALRRHGFFYTAGVILSFLVLAGVLLALRHAGEQIGWGFQLQEPRFVAALALLMFVMAMSFAGLLELGAGLAGIGQRLTEGAGDRSAFFSGVLACAVASPCTAPFMGTALGYAMVQPAPAALLVFAALGLGLAMPMLLLGLVPALARRLPRPGAWMLTFRQLLAFPLLLTVVWLLWVYGEQTSALNMAWLLAAMVLVAFGLWWRQQSSLAWVGLLLVLAGVAAPLLSPDAAIKDSRPAVQEQAEAWSEARLAALRMQGRPILVNMTAAWCITCLANERSTLATSEIQQALQRSGVAYLKGDWTRRDPAITRYLQQFGRNGVPLYVLYPASSEPRLLPQILTPALVKAALAELASTSPPVPPTGDSK